jgi:hypothetical protein
MVISLFSRDGAGLPPGRGEERQVLGYRLAQSSPCESFACHYHGEMHSEAVSNELLRTVSATLPLGEVNVLQSPGAKGTGGAGAKKLIS